MKRGPARSSQGVNALRHEAAATLLKAARDGTLEACAWAGARYIDPITDVEPKWRIFSPKFQLLVPKMEVLTHLSRI